MTEERKQIIEKEDLNIIFQHSSGQLHGTSIHWDKNRPPNKKELDKILEEIAVTFDFKKEDIKIMSHQLY